jgi:hypothetical protein
MNLGITRIILCAASSLSWVIMPAAMAARPCASARPMGINAVRRVFVVIQENQDFSAAIDDAARVIGDIWKK